jgi:hypothetical protein
MSITPSPIPGPGDQPAPDSALGSGGTSGQAKPSHTPLIVVAIVMVLGLGGLFLYTKSLNDSLEQTQQSLQASLDSQGKSLEQIASRLNQTETQQQELQGEVGATKQTLGTTRSELQKTRQTAAELAKQQQAAKQELASRIGELAEDQETTKGNLGNLSTDVTGVKGDVTTTKADLEKTKTELQRVIGDLGAQSDLIAHTRGDLDSLRKLGERDYVEFDLRKSNNRQKVGSLQLELKKTDVKHQRYTMNLIVDDRTIEKKDKTLFEPVQFYQIGYRQPTEIVVQQIFKDRVTGYVSSPKVRSAQTTADNTK